MKNLFLILVFILLTSAVPTYVRTADKPEYELYKKWCAKVVSKRLEQSGKFTLLKKDGYYTKPDGSYTKSTKATSWYSLSTKSFTINENEKIVSRFVIVNEANDATPTIKEFYTIWMVAKYTAEIKRLQEAIANPDYADHTVKLTKQLNFTRTELTKIQ